MMNHANCSHPATPAARAACRKASAGQPVSSTTSKPARGMMPEGTPTTGSGFPLTTCTRCGGTGTYPSAAWQGKCLGCAGTGHRDFNRPSRRQRLAYEAAVIESQTTPVTDIAAGDRVLMPYGMSSWKWMTVESVAADDLNPGRVILQADGSGSSYDQATTVRRAAPRVDPAPFLAKINYNAR